jgi:hypothetical protein
MNTYTKIGGPPWGAQKSTNRMSFCALRESGGVSDLALVASAFRPASLALSSKEKSLRRLSRLRDGLRQQGTVRNGQQIIGVVGPKKAVHITAFFRQKRVAGAPPFAPFAKGGSLPL